MNELNIFQRINAVMKEVTYVQKDKAVSAGQGGNYKAVTHDNLVSVARSSMVNNGIVMFPVQVSGELMPPSQKADGSLSTMRIYEGKYDFHFVNIDKTDDRITVSVAAHAADNGDKAPGKCLTYAAKQAVLKLLWLETGENEESREELRERQKPKKEKLTQERFKNALTAVRSGEFPLDQLLSRYEFNDGQTKELQALEAEMETQQ